MTRRRLRATVLTAGYPSSSPRLAWWLGFLLIILSRSAAGQLPDLSQSEYAALARASQANVAGTIAFLASDELAGRATPSPELTIASRYVASRLMAAGAQGLGTDGSYFLPTQLATHTTPREGAVLLREGEFLRTRLLYGGSTAIDYSGPIHVAAEEVPFSGPVAVELDPASGDPLVQLMKAGARLSAQGATALIALVPAGDAFWERAMRLQNQPRPIQPRNRFALPVLIAESEVFIAGDAYTLHIPPNVEQIAIVRNVAAVIRGSDPQLATEAVLFSAHLDHLGSGAAGSDPVFNGADDDASGVTAVLTLADVFRALDPAPQRSTIFVTFWGEERGLLGSQAFVEQAPWPLEKIVANFNLEMIGRPEPNAENKMWMTGWQESNLGDLAAQGSRRLGVETFEHPAYSARLYRASDNYSLAKRGVIAHSFSAGSLHADYHQPGDEWEKLDLVHMTQIIRGLFAAALPIARGDATPKAR